MPVIPGKIVSGGQTGVDRAALDAALALGVPVGGWCPLDRKAEDGRIPDRYPVTETTSPSYKKRTKLNVQDSDGTLVLNIGALDGGTLATVKIARELKQPCLVVKIEVGADVGAILEWLSRNSIRVLNVAGPRVSKRPGIYSRALELLELILQPEALEHKKA